MLKFRAVLFAGALAALPSLAAAGQSPPSQTVPVQAPVPQPPPATAAAQTVCGLAIPAPARLPPAGSGPLVDQVLPCFHKQGGASAIDTGTYISYIQMHGS